MRVTETQKKILLVVVVAIMLIVAQQKGIFHLLGDEAWVRKTLKDLGAWGVVAFVAAYALLQPFGVPGTVFVFVAPLVWPWPVAFGASMTGTMAASVVGFSFARFIARDWVSSRIPERFRRYERALAERGFVTVFTLRFLFWMPPLLHAFFGVSKVPFWTHFWGSLAGYVLPLLAVSYFGERVFVYLKNAPPRVWIAIAASVLCGGLVAFFWRRHRRRHGPEEAKPKAVSADEPPPRSSP